MMADKPFQTRPGHKVKDDGRSAFVFPPRSLTADDFMNQENSFCRMLMDNVPDLVWAKDMRGRYLFTNKAMCRSLLMCEDTREPLGRTDLFFARREKARGYLHTFGELCVDSDRVVVESRREGRFIEEGFVRGKWLALDVFKAPLFNDQGEMIGTVGSGRDITREKEFESKLVKTISALEKSEERFRQLADTLPIPLGEYDFQFRLSYVNRAALESLGYDPGDFSDGTRIIDLIPRDKWRLVIRRTRQLEKGIDPGPIEMTFIKKDGSLLFGVVYPAVIFEDDVPVGIRTCLLDLTRRRQAEADLQESETKFRTLFNGLNEAVFLHPYTEKGFGRFMEVNDAACHRYGYTREEFHGLSPEDLHDPDADTDVGSPAERQQLMQAGRRTFEMVHVKKSGEAFPVEVSSSVFEFHGEKLILSTVRNITDRKLREQERAEADKFAAEQEKYALVGQVAGKMAHDFNNILGGIMGNADMALMDCNQPEIAENLDIILKQTLRGRNLTRNLVAFAKDQEPKESYFNLNEKIDLVLNLLKKDLDGIEVVRRYESGMPDLLADSGMIEHALVNLVQNAIHAMGLRPSPRLGIRTRLKRNRLIIEIEDNGCGIPKKFQKDIYAPSFTLKGSKDILGAYPPDIKGTGYGMSNVKKYIEKHKGSISFTSREDAGSCFVLSIPVIKKELTRSEKQRIRRHPTVRQKRILLVEDEPAIAGVQQRILSQEPFRHQVVLAKTGQEAIRAFDTQSFDLVSLDYILPGRLNGLDVYRYIRSKDSGIPILFISGNIGFLESMKDIRITDRRMDHLSKPCENIIYADTVNRWLLKGLPGYQ